MGPSNALVPPASTVQQWMKDLRAGVNEMHSVGLAHADIKPENLLLFQTREDHEQLKLADFDFVTNLWPLSREGGHRGLPEYGTHGYMAPQVWSRRTGVKVL